MIIFIFPKSIVILFQLWNLELNRVSIDIIESLCVEKLKKNCFYSFHCDDEDYSALSFTRKVILLHFAFNNKWSFHYSHIIWIERKKNLL